MEMGMEWEEFVEEIEHVGLDVDLCERWRGML